MDCANVPPEWLGKAARRWIDCGDGFLPSASALIKLATEEQAKAVPIGSGSKQEEAKAYRIELERMQAEHTATLRKLWHREIPEHQLSFVSENTFRSAIAEGSCMLMKNGARLYRTKETIAERDREAVLSEYPRMTEGDQP